MEHEQAFYDGIAEEFIGRQPYRSTPHPPTLLIFSGVPGSGKTTLARNLAADLQAQYINHDEIRDFMRSQDVDPTTVYMPAVSISIEKQIIANDANKFVILDGSVDRSWEIFFKTAKELLAKTITIRFDVPLEVARERLRIRDKDNTKLQDGLARFQKDLEECKKHVQADLTLGENYKYAAVLEFVKSKLLAVEPN